MKLSKLFFLVACLAAIFCCLMPAASANDDSEYVDPFSDCYSFALSLKAKGHASKSVCDCELQHILESVRDICTLDYPDLDPFYVLAIIETESSFISDSTSDKGACGLMQIVTKYHKARMDRLGTSQLYGVVSNILVGCDYLNELYQGYGCMSKALRHYHGGPSAIWNDTCYEYADLVNSKYKALREEY